MSSKIQDFNNGWAIFRAGLGANRCVNSDEVAGWDASELYGPTATDADRDKCSARHTESAIIQRAELVVDDDGFIWAPN